MTFKSAAQRAHRVGELAGDLFLDRSGVEQARDSRGQRHLAKQPVQARQHPIGMDAAMPIEHRLQT